MLFRLIQCTYLAAQVFPPRLFTIKPLTHTPLIGHPPWLPPLPPLPTLPKPHTKRNRHGPHGPQAEVDRTYTLSNQPIAVHLTTYRHTPGNQPLGLIHQTRNCKERLQQRRERRMQRDATSDHHSSPPTSPCSRKVSPLPPCPSTIQQAPGGYLPTR